MTRQAEFEGRDRRNERFGRDGINQLPALANGRLEGMISRDQILRYLLIRAELEM